MGHLKYGCTPRKHPCFPDINLKSEIMTKEQIINGYVQAEKPYEVCAHTCLGGYMEFMCLEPGIMFEENAKEVAKQYASQWGKSSNVKGVCVRKHGVVIYEVTI